MRSRLLLVAAATAAAAAVVAPPASADTSGVTSMSMEIVAGGGLSIIVPGNAGSPGTRVSTSGPGIISGALGQVKVVDARSAPANSTWTASAIATAFTPPAGPALPASAVGYIAGEIVKTGTATYEANDPTNLTGVSPVVTATGISGDNSATWTPTIKLTVPGGMAAGVYTATITHSVV